jgi:membrane protease YdiL (CAAX protease family)
LLGVDVVVELLLVLGVGLFWLGGIGPRDIGWRGDAPRADLARGVVGFALASLVVLGFALGSGASLAEIGHEVATYSVKQRVFFLGVGLMAGITEESIYRGYLQPALAARLGLSAGIIVTALVFAAAHLRFSALALSGKFAVGVVLGLLRGQDRSLLAPGLAHALLWVFWGTV